MDNIIQNRYTCNIKKIIRALHGQLTSLNN